MRSITKPLILFRTPDSKKYTLKAANIRKSITGKINLKVIKVYTDLQSRKSIIFQTLSKLILQNRIKEFKITK